VPKYGIPIVFVQTHQWTSHAPATTATFALRVGLGVLKSLWILLRKRPDAVIGTGGYVAAPLIFANLILRKLRLSMAKTIIHEQNITPGKLNALVGRMADLMLVSFAATKRYFPHAVYVGYPVRAEIHPLDQREARRSLGIPDDAQVVLAFGGSMGARTINRALIDALPNLRKRPNLRIIHGTGRKLTAYDPIQDCRQRLEINGLRPDDLDGWYEVHEFIDNMALYYAAADLVVARGGAGTLAEVCASGKPSLLIPKSNLSGDHQVMNALELAKAGAAVVMYEDVAATGSVTEEFVSGTELARTITDLLDDPDLLESMSEKAHALASPGALRKTVAIIDNLIRGEKPAPGCAEHTAPEVPTSRFSGLAWLTGERLKARADGLVTEAQKQLTALDTEPRKREEELIARMRDDEMFAYLRYRAAGSVASSAWRIRNAGVKMVGILRMRDKLPVLLSLFNDRTPVSRLKRLLGGDFVQNGFIRRNIVDALIPLGIYNDDVRRALLNGLSDPYYEVRSHTARTICGLADLIGEDDALEQALISATYDGRFEVVMEAASALGCIGRASISGRRLRELVWHENWKIRQAVLSAVENLLQRGQITDTAQIRSDLKEMVITSTGFVPIFALKNTIQHLGEMLRVSEDREQPGGRQ